MSANPSYTVRRFVDGKAVEVKPKTTMGTLPQEYIIIEHNVPIPPPINNKPYKISPINETAERMKVGDSILVPYMRESLASSMSRHTGYTFTQRKVGDKLRIWRVA